jgi:RNA polymerase sigma-70 factor (ECF subfamily)
MLKLRIFRIVRHREGTEDVLQETLLSAYQHLHTFRGTCRFSSWIMKIGINTSLSLRKRKTLHCGSNPPLVTERNPEAPPKVRNVMILYYREDRRLKDAASTLGITEQSAKSRVLRARRMLRPSLKENECWTP